MKSGPKVVSVVGAGPQFIKLVVLACELSGCCRHTIIHTGQHFDDNMSEIFFRQLRIPGLHVNLGVGGGTRGAVTGCAPQHVEKALLAEKPVFELVHGDTNSTLTTWC